MAEDLINKIFQEFLAEHIDKGDIDFSPLLSSHPELRSQLEKKIAAFRRVSNALESNKTPSSTSDELNGKTIGGCFIKRVIKRGGMSTVYLATQTTLGRDVALKILKDTVTDSESSLGRFRRESQNIAKLDHENILPVYDVGEDDGRHYVITKYVEGVSLEEVIDFYKKKGAQPTIDEIASLTGGSVAEWRGKFKNYLDFAVATIIKTAKALEFTHTRGIIHRDVKPSNILIKTNGEPVLIDYGLSRDFHQTSMTMTGEYLGTPVYSSPEQLFGDQSEVDQQSDVYSLGMTFCELLTGQLPYSGKNLLDVLTNIKTVEPTITDTVCGEIKEVLLKSISKAKGQRYKSANEFIRDLSNVKIISDANTKPLRSAKPRPLSGILAVVFMILVSLVGLVTIIYRSATNEEVQKGPKTSPHTEIPNVKDYLESESALMNLYRNCISSGEDVQLRKTIANNLNAMGKTRMGVFSMIGGDRRDVCILGGQVILFKTGYHGNHTEIDLTGLKDSDIRFNILRALFDNAFGQGFADSYFGPRVVEINSVRSVTVIYFYDRPAVMQNDEFGKEYITEPGTIKPAYYAVMLSSDAGKLNWENLDNVTGESFSKLFSEKWIESQNWYFSDSGLPASSFSSDSDSSSEEDGDPAVSTLLSLQYAAEQGDADAQNNLAKMYYKGVGVQKNLQNALDWFLKAAEQGLAEAQYNFASMHANGQGTPKDLGKAHSWFLKSAEQGYTVAQYSLAVMSYNGQGVPKDLQIAHDWFLKAAEQGDAEAQNYLARMYYDGEGVSKDLQKAYHWYSKAAAQGNSDSQAVLAAMYCWGEGVPKDFVQAYKWLNISSMTGDPLAVKARDILEKNMTKDQISQGQKLVTEWLENFRTQSNSTTLAGSTDLDQWAEKSDQILPDSSAKLLTDLDVSNLSAEQLGFARNEIFARHGYAFTDKPKSKRYKDYFEVKNWYRPNPNYDGSISEIEKYNVNLIKWYEGYKNTLNDSVGSTSSSNLVALSKLKQDLPNLQQAAGQGDAEAQFNLARMYYNGEGVQKNLQKAYAWFLKASQQGHATAQYDLGLMCYNGQGAPVDFKKAHDWFLKAAEQRYAEAQYSLATMYYSGKGVLKDLQKAHDWYLKAAEQGDVTAQYVLAKMYYNAEGVPIDLQKAHDWYLKAAKQGSSDSQAVIGAMYYRGEGGPKDLIQAYKWIHLSSMRGDNLAADARDALEKEMTKDQISQGQRLVAEWLESFRTQSNSTILADPADLDQWPEKQVLILKSTQDYDEALKTAQEASSALMIRMDLRELSANKETGLTFSEYDCNESNFNFPCYIARGRSDDGIYISIEHSSAYQNFKPGYYIVVAAIYSPNDKEIDAALLKVRGKYTDAYIKSTKVYTGCLH